MVARAVVERVNDAKKMQLVQLGILTDETREDIERVQNYGFTGVPLEGAEAVVVFVGGRRDHGLAIAVDDRRYRVKGLKPGEVAIYTDEGDQITIKRGGNITVKGAAKVIVDSPLVELAQPATDAAVKGTTYRAAEDTLITSLSAFATAAGVLAAALVPGTGVAPGAQAPFAAAVAAFTAAVATFSGASSTYLSTKVKVG